MEDTKSVYQVVGGQPFFDALAARFYECVEANDVLRPLYPAELDVPRSNLSWFLAQYWGGPPVYSNERGHPRLRMRHARFSIGSTERNAWVDCMKEALDSFALPEDIKAGMNRHFERTATMLINRTKQPSGSDSGHVGRTLQLSGD